MPTLLPLSTATPPTDRAWQRAVAVVIGAVLFAYLGVGGLGGILGIGKQWLRADYSHGFVVVPFAVYLLWLNRAKFPEKVRWPDPRGYALIVVPLVIYLIEARINYAKEWVQGACLIVSLAGVVVTFCGRWAGLKWALPALTLLVLALPLPDFVEREVSWQLRKVAAVVAVWVFRTLGFASHLNGKTVIDVETVQLGVEQACSGLSMLLPFVATAAAIVLLCPPTRPKLDRWIILLSSIPIAVVCNVGRIVVCGLVKLAGWQWLFDIIVHEYAGWFMPPVGLGLIWLEFKLIDWLLVPVQYMSREEVMRAGFAEARAEIERQEAERRAMQEAIAARTGKTPPPVGEPHPVAPFLPLTKSGTSHGATASGGTFTQPRSVDTPPPQFPQRPPEKPR